MFSIGYCSRNSYFNFGKFYNDVFFSTTAGIFGSILTDVVAPKPLDSLFLDGTFSVALLLLGYFASLMIPYSLYKSTKAV